MNVPVVLGIVIALSMLAALAVMLVDALRAPPGPEASDASAPPPDDPPA